MKKPGVSRVVLALGFALTSLPGWAGAAVTDGVSGVGNTTDLTIQLELTQQAGLKILREVSSFDLEDVSRDQEAADLYRACRDTMYRGGVDTRFTIVDVIPDGSDYHALAKRTATTEIQVSRREIDRLSQAGTLSGGLLVTVFLHEVAHDCKLGPNRVDDSFDPLINRMVQSLLKASQQATNGSFRDLEFIAQVRSGKRVSYDDLSPGVRRILSDAYINYLGDWLYESLKERFRYRPAPATDFYATAETSVYPGWALVREAMTGVSPEVEALVFGVMRASFEEKSLSVYRDFRRDPLPTRLACKERFDNVENLSFAECDLIVSWSSLPLATLQPGVQRVRFEVDSLSRGRVTGIQFGLFPKMEMPR